MIIYCILFVTGTTTYTMLYISLSRQDRMTSAEALIGARNAMLTCGCGRWMHTEGIEERTCEDGSQKWFIRSECRGCGLKIGVDVPAGQIDGLWIV